MADDGVEAAGASRARDSRRRARQVESGRLKRASPIACRRAPATPRARATAAPSNDSANSWRAPRRRARDLDEDPLDAAIQVARGYMENAHQIRLRGTVMMSPGFTRSVIFTFLIGLRYPGAGSRSGSRALLGHPAGNGERLQHADLAVELEHARRSHVAGDGVFLRLRHADRVAVLQRDVLRAAELDVLPVDFDRLGVRRAGRRAGRLRSLGPARDGDHRARTS